MRPIDADELLKKLLALFNYRIVERDDIKETVDSMPTIEKKHGHWINDSIYHCRCSICDHIIEGTIHYYNIDSFNNDNAYCKHCGAKMDEEVM